MPWAGPLGRLWEGSYNFWGRILVSIGMVMYRLHVKVPGWPCKKTWKIMTGTSKAKPAASLQPALLSLIFAGLLPSVVTSEIAPETA